MTVKSAIMRALDAWICLTAKMWRPVLYCLYIVSFAVNLVLIPIWNWEVPDLMAAATYLSAGAALAGLRTYEKKLGVARGVS